MEFDSSSDSHQEIKPTATSAVTTQESRSAYGPPT